LSRGELQVQWSRAEVFSVLQETKAGDSPALSSAAILGFGYGESVFGQFL